MTDSAAFDDWVAQARREDIAAHARRLCEARGVKLKRAGAELVGPCPVCGGHDRFAVNTRKGVFHCRGSGASGDVIDLVKYVDGLDFPAACEALTGRPRPGAADASPADDAELAKRRAEQEAARRAEADAQAREENQYRESERGKAYAIWKAGAPIAGTPAEAYLRGRGIEPPECAPLRFLPELPYWHAREEARRHEHIYAGPAMLAAITDHAGRFAGVHCTWVDAERPGGKARIPDPDRDGEFLIAKKVRGSKKRAAIKLVTPATFWRLVTGEGIETVLSVYEAELVHAQPLVTHTAYWSACDLGHLAGSATDTVPHPALTRLDKAGRKRPVRVPGPWPKPQPDRDLMPPDCMTEIVLLGDGDSDRVTTELALTRAAERWRAPERTIRWAWAPADTDFNDLLRGE